MTDAEFRRIMWVAVTGRAASLADALEATMTIPCDDWRAVDDTLSRLEGQIRDSRKSLVLRAIPAHANGPGTRQAGTGSVR